MLTSEWRRVNPARQHRIRTIAVIMVGLGCACRDREPTPAYNRNLGTEERPLLPDTPVLYDPELGKVNKKVEIPKRPEPGTPSQNSAEAPAGEAAPPDAAVQASAGEAIQALVKRANDALAAGEFDVLVGMTVPEQRELAEANVKALRDLSEGLDRLGKAMEEKAPGSGAGLQQISTMIMGQKVQVGTISFEGEASASAPIVGSPIPGLKMHFRSVDGQWKTYTHESQMALQQQQSAGVKTFADEIAKLAGDVESGAKAPAAVLPALQQAAMKMAAQLMSAVAATTDGTTNGTTNGE